jgi:hypothetical protein
MADTLELPTGDAVAEGEVFLYNDYPYRLRWLDDPDYDFLFSPLFWGDSGMDIPFRDREALVDQWESGGVRSPEGWERWLDRVADDERFGDEEVTALAAELPVD